MRDGDQAVAELTAGQEGLIVLDQTAFYAEGGGQVGDQGIIRSGDGTFRVTDTRRIDDRHIAHFGVVESGVLRGGGDVQGEVDRAHRANSARHHTVTHILHRTLKDVLGESTEQKGSLVAPHVARFDFNYPRGLTREQLEQINATINRHVLENLPVAWQVMDIDQAREAGAVAIFGEKYGNQVRVVDIGGWSKELCGGTHVHRSGDVGTAILVREARPGERHPPGGSAGRRAGVQPRLGAAGAPAAPGADGRRAGRSDRGEADGAPVEDLDQARREASRLEQQLAARSATQLVDSAVQVSDVKVLAAQVDASSRDALRDMADQLRAKLGTSVVALGASFDGQQAFVVGASRDAIERGANAGEILRQALAAAGGKGGGRPDFAQGGVKEAGQLGVALAQVVPLVERAVGGA